MTLVPVVLGIALSTKGESDFILIGAIAATVCTALRALKSVLQGVLLNNDVDRLDSLNLMFYSAPMSGLLLIPFVIWLEPTALQHEWLQSLPNLSLLVTNCLLAYLMNLFNFLLTQVTSPLTLQVAGTAKGALGALCSWVFFHNHITRLGIVGYSISLAGCFWYTSSKRSPKLNDSTKHIISSMPLLPKSTAEGSPGSGSIKRALSISDLLYISAEELDDGAHELVDSCLNPRA